MRALEFGWFTPLKVSGVALESADGQPLLAIEQVVGDRSLLALVQSPMNLGSLVITRPQVHLQLRPDGSNLEDVVNRLAELGGADEATPPSSPSEPAMVDVRIQLVDAEVVATEVATQRTWKLQDLQANAMLPASREAVWEITARGTLDGHAFDLAFASPLGLATETWPLGPEGALTLQAQTLPMSPVRYVAVRAGQSIDELQGDLSADWKIQWQPDPSGAELPSVSVQGVLQVNDLVVAAAELLGQDVLRMRSATLQTQAKASDHMLAIEQATFNSDYGAMSLVSSVAWKDLQDPNALLARLRQQQLKTQGEVNLAALSQSLPHTLGIHKDIHIAGGKFQWHIEAAPQANSVTRWTGKLQTSDIQVLRNDLPLDWQFPLDVDFAVVDGPELALEKLTATSFFFALSGQGGIREGQVHAKANLERLMYQLGQVLDVNNMYLRGQLQTVLNWREVQPNQLALENRTRLVDFVMTQNEQMLCQEPELHASVQATATLDGQQIASLDTSRIDVIADQDFLVAELQQPVVQPQLDSDWRVACRLKGDLTSWFARLKTLGMGQDWQVAGQIDTTAQVAMQGNVGEIQGLNVDVRNLQAISESLQVQEPTLQIQTAGTVDLATGGCRFPKTKFSSQSVSCEAHQLTVQTTPGFVVAGDVDYRADLGRVLAMVSREPSENSQQMHGEATGRLHLQADGQTTRFRLDGALENLIVRDANGITLWQEPQAKLATEGSYDASTDSLQLSQTQIAGKALRLTAAGQATELSSHPRVDFSGEYGYDLAGLTTILRDMLGPDIMLAGQQQHAFAVRGPLFPVPPEQGYVAAELNAQFQAGWQSAEAYGIALGAAQLDAALQNSTLVVQPMNIPVGEGYVRAAPTLYLNTDAMWLTLAPGPVLDRVRIDPRMTAGWMKYITPLMADATAAEGTFSVNLAKAEVPLADPMQGRIDGQFVIHGGSLGPGPMASQLLDLATQVKRLTGNGESRIVDSTKSWVQLGEQQIDFQMTEGRVYHRGFQMTVDGVPIRTEGSVGVVDQSLDVVATVPIQDAWIKGSPNLAGLRGQVISVPIRGTTSSPQLDQRALTQATMQLARQGASSYLQGQIQDKLGGKLQSALGGGTLGRLLGGSDPNQADPNAGASAPTQPPQDLGTQLQDRAQEEISKQLNKLFK